MSYDVSAHYAAETFLKNRLNVLQEPTMGMNHGRNAPLNLTDDIYKCVVNAEEQK
jgi:hypothetical protein